MIFTRRTLPNALGAAKRFLFSIFRKEELILASDFVQDVRKARCRRCPFYADGQCLKCTCVVELKVMLANERCPLLRPSWIEQTKQSTGI